MRKKYVATIMDRHFLGESSFIFNCNHVALGMLDESSKIFEDQNGNQYASILSPDLLASEIPYAYSNIMELGQLKDYFGGDISLKEAISEYEYLCRSYLYYVGKNSQGAPFYLSLDANQLREMADKVRSSSISITEEEEVEEDFDNELEELIIDVVNGKYSLNELKELRNNIKEKEEDLTNVLDTVELQIEASEKGESFITLPKDSEEDENASLMEKVSVVADDNLFDSSIDIQDLFQKVTKTLIAQDEPARRVIAEIARKEMDSRKKKEGILLTGPTGVGKTELMRLIAKYLNKPFFKVNSTQLTIPGYVGKDIEEVLWDLYVQCEGDLEKTESAIIFFDEIDKKGSSKKSDVSGQGVLNVLLPFIEGSTYDACADIKGGMQKVKIRTDNMTVILGGAYTDVYKNLLEKNGIGFGNEVSSTPRYRKATTKDFVERGLMTDEFMGRVSVVKLNDLDVSSIKRIMLESDESAMKIQKDIFQKMGVKLTFTDGFTTVVAENAFEKKTGARGLNGIIDEATWVAFEDVYSHRGEYQEVILDEETVHNPAKYQLIKKKRI